MKTSVLESAELGEVNGMRKARFIEHEMSHIKIVYHKTWI